MRLIEPNDDLVAFREPERLAGDDFDCPGVRLEGANPGGERRVFGAKGGDLSRQARGVPARLKERGQTALTSEQVGCEDQDSGDDDEFHPRATE